MNKKFIAMIFMFCVCANQVLAQKKTSPEYLCLFAEDLLRAGLYDEAVEKLLEIVSKDPEYFCALRNLGVVYQTKGNKDLAIKYYLKASAIYPEFPKIHDDLGLLYNSMGKGEEAKSHFKIACEKGIKPACDDIKKIEVAVTNTNKPDTADYYYQEGKNFQTQGQYENALQSFKKAVEKDPKHHMALNELGYEYEMKGMIDDALKSYQACIDIKPDYGKCYDNMGFAYKKQNKMKESKKSFAKACELGVTEACADAGKPAEGGEGGCGPNYNYDDGIEFLNKKDWESAISSFEKALFSSPCHYAIHDKLAEAYFENGKNDIALIHAQKALDYNPAYGEAYFTMSKIFKKMNKNAESQKNQKKACDLGFKDACK
jgi:tetratricopeptide (TPR) repeat protein